MNKFSSKILRKIKKEHIKLVPKWHFVFRNVLFWIVFVISLFFGALSFAVTLLFLLNTDWSLHDQLHSNFVHFLFISLPYFWIIFLILFAIIAHIDLRHTEKGYRYRTVWMLIGNISIVVISGAIFYNFGLAHEFDERFQKHMPFYGRMMNREQIWLCDDCGLLAGKIISVDNMEIIILEDLKNQIWTVNISKADIHPYIKFEKGEKIKSVGEKKEENYFEAEKIDPWLLPPPMMMREMMR